MISTRNHYNKTINNQLRFVGTLEKIYEEQPSMHICPFLVDLYGSFTTQDYACLVTEYLPGGSIQQRIQDTGGAGLPNDQVKFVACELVSLISHMHSCGMMIRSLRPTVIMLDKEGHIKLANYNFVRVMRRQSFATQKTSTTAYDHQSTYCAPEMLQGQLYSKQVDWGVYL
eukprot:TRINITY_DN9261_c0_g1_i2.p1 TRINITY_DN9261_c0_g1~~TRINITY_DN9261_c0_g1_i2.p1  ORF type:complete len:171 (-),score=31.39 TRINITY_DN9261_c0_g1_i2:643-1155(-)